MKENLFFRLIGMPGIMVVTGLFWLAQISISSGADPIPQNRRIAWQPGVVGGIPNRTTIFRTLTPANTLADINSAISSCPSNQVVYLAAGTYNLLGNILIRKDGVTVRGAGPGRTILVFANSSWANVFFLGQDFNDPNTTQPNNLVNWTGGYAQGTTSLTLSSTSGLNVGSMLMLDQLNDNVDVNGAGSEGCTYCGRLTGGRAQIQGVKVTGISGNTVTITPGLYMPNWTAARSPQAWWFGTSLEMSGIEDLTINNLTSGSQISMAFKNSRNCWAKNVESSSTLSSDHYHVKSYIAAHIEVRHCYFKGVLNAPGSDHYGVDWFWGWDCLAEDNIFSGVTSPLVLEASSEGNVNAYNFLTNMLYYDQTWQLAGMMGHAAHNAFNLFEGNYGNEVYLDFIHGSGSHTTILRNRITGFETGRDSNTYCVSAQYMNHYINVIGNILGTSGYHNLYECANGACNSSRAIFYLGYDGTQGNYPSGYDAAVPGTLIRSGNYDYVTRPTVVSTDIPVSYIHVSKPAWFGDRPWPPYDPAKPNSNSLTNIPAGYRYVFGVDPPTGPVNQAPVAVASANPKSGNPPLTVAFSSAGSSDPEGTALTYSWTFGDGTTSTAANPSKIYLAAGSYTARLTVSDGVNTTSSTNITILVGNQSPVALASASVASGSAPLQVDFSSAGSLDPEGLPVTYSWVFGDGTTSTAANPTHTYSTIGVFTARLTVSDGVNTAVSSDLAINVFSATNGLVAAYGFNEGSGTSTADSSGNQNAGAINGATWTTQGKYGQALSFNGLSDVVVVNNSPSLNVSSAMTLEAWVYPTASQTSWRAVMHRETDAYYLHAGSPAGSLLPAAGAIFNGTESYVAASTAIPVSAWTHLAGTYDGSTVRLYVNGTQVATKAVSGGIQNNSNPFRIGGNTYADQFFQGLIDEVRIYNRALSATEIQNDMNVAVGGTGLVAAPTGLRVIPD